MADVIRTATVADAEGIARVHVASSLAVSGGRGAVTAEGRVERWRAWLSADEFAVWVADESGIAGFAARAKGGDPIELHTIYVAPDRWGRGLGQALLAAATAGCPRVALWTFEENARARRFYRAAGFVPDGERRTQVGRPVEIRYMLSPPSTSMVRPLK